MGMRTTWFVHFYWWKLLFSLWKEMLPAVRNTPSIKQINSHLVCDLTIQQPGFDLPRQQWSLLNRFRTEQGHCGAYRRKWRLTDTDLHPCGETQTMSIVSNLVPWQNWLAAYLGYTVVMKMLFPGWPVMVHDTHTRRRSVILCVQIYCCTWIEP